MRVMMKGIEQRRSNNNNIINSIWLLYLYLVITSIVDDVIVSVVVVGMVERIVAYIYIITKLKSTIAAYFLYYVFD